MSDVGNHPDANCADKLRVISDPTRLSVVEMLMSGPRRVSDLNDVLGIEQSLLSHHLRVLRDAGFVVTRRAGKGILYDLSPEFRGEQAATLDLGCCAIRFDSERPGEKSS